MRKGDLRRKEILDAAEQLFYQKGYEATSVQDVLDALGMSKGGFYHHFESKVSVLEAICDRRVEEQYAKAAQEIRSARTKPVEKLNRLFDMINLFEREEVRFIAVLLKIAYQGTDVALREHMKAVTFRMYLPLLNEILASGIADKTFFTRYPGVIGDVVLRLAHDAVDDASDRLVSGAENPECLIEIIELLNAYRESIELLLNAPYGSVKLFDMEHMLDVFRDVLAEIELQSDRS